MATSSSDRTSTSDQQQQGAQRVVRKPPFADWPTIKIVTPPQGRFSPKTDEWCITFFNQSIAGRIQGEEPNVRSFCLRRVFAHEVRNVMQFKKHNVAADGKARYPLPGEGQPANLPRILGGLPKEPEFDPEDGLSAPPPATPPTNHWDEGWYLWSGKGMWSTITKMNTMRLDLQRQHAWSTKNQKDNQDWEKYQAQLRQGPGEPVGELGYGTRSKATPPWPDVAASSILIPIPPEVPSIREKIDKLLTPTYRAIAIFRESLAANEHPRFAKMAWEKAQTREPFVLAGRTLERTYDQWKRRNATGEDDEKKGST